MKFRLFIFLLLGTALPLVFSRDSSVQLDQESINNVLESFARAHNQLDILKIGLGVQGKRGVWDPEQSCTVTKSSLDDLQNTIDNTLNNVEVIKNSVKCQYDPNVGQELNCAEMIQLIQCGFYHVQDGFTYANQNSVSLKQYQELQNAVEDLQRKYHQELDAMKQTVSQEYQKVIDNLVKQIQGLNEALNQSNKRLKEALIEIAALKVKDGEFSAAVFNWDQINDESVIEEIIQKAYYYATNAGANTQQTIEFLFYIKDRSTFYDAYKAFMSVLRTPINEPTVMVLTAALQEKGYSSDASQHKSETVKIWSYAIRNSESTDLNLMISFSSKYSSQLEQTQVITDIVNEVYSGADSSSSNDGFFKMCDFIYQLATSTQKSEGYSQMINRMSSFDNLNAMKLAVKINLAGLDLDYKFPAGIRNVIFRTNSRCKLKNNYYNEYVYSVINDYAFDSSRRRVLSWTPGNIIAKSDWQTALRYTGGKTDEPYFLIRNVDFNEYLYTAVYDKLIIDGSRRMVMTWRQGNFGDDDDQFAWYFKPINNGNDLLIKSYKFNEYLYADGANFFLGGDRRMILTYRNGMPTGQMYSESKWSLIC